ncbi:hypothetical protein DPEC_G00111810 [Dallia pectoralis]|uniref:Uncharacterized protein n=1 Tax=Dallia pectoralis TaxID=75939 RepID=A0ACC2GU04_DALPE|nr:hypothetical protein DPEC_G00111810 [Dallia pectoralis]
MRTGMAMKRHNSQISPSHRGVNSISLHFSSSPHPLLLALRDIFIDLLGRIPDPLSLSAQEHKTHACGQLLSWAHRNRMGEWRQLIVNVITPICYTRDDFPLPSTLRQPRPVRPQDTICLHQSQVPGLKEPHLGSGERRGRLETEADRGGKANRLWRSQSKLSYETPINESVTPCLQNTPLPGSRHDGSVSQTYARGVSTCCAGRTHTVPLRVHQTVHLRELCTSNYQNPPLIMPAGTTPTHSGQSQIASQRDTNDGITGLTGETLTYWGPDESHSVTAVLFKHRATFVYGGSRLSHTPSRKESV